jgi:hypothetical protein
MSILKVALRQTPCPYVANTLTQTPKLTGLNRKSASRYIPKMPRCKQGQRKGHHFIQDQKVQISYQE